MGIEGVGSKQFVGVADVEDQNSPGPSAEAAGSSVEAYATKEFDSVMGPAVEKFARQHEDPTNCLDNVDITDAQLRHSAVGQALEDPRTSAALAKMNEGQVRNVIENEIHKAWPKLDGEQTHDLVNKFVDQVKESARYHAMEGMRKEAVSTFRDAAGRTKDPEQKKLFEKEASRLERAGGDSVFRAMADHDVSTAFMKKAGISPESLAGNQVEAAREQGHEDKEKIEYMKMACAVTAAVATGGLGAAGVAGYATGALGAVAINGAGVHEKWEAVDSAKAGEAAGTMKADAVTNARINASVATGLMAFEALAGPLASKAAHPIEHAIAPAFENVATQATVKSIAHGISDGGITLGAQLTELAAHKENE